MKKTNLFVLICTLGSLATLRGRSVATFDVLDYGVLVSLIIVWAVFGYAKWRGKAWATIKMAGAVPEKGQAVDLLPKMVRKGACVPCGHLMENGRPSRRLLKSSRMTRSGRKGCWQRNRPCGRLRMPPLNLYVRYSIINIEKVLPHGICSARIKFSQNDRLVSQARAVISVYWHCSQAYIQC